MGLCPAVDKATKRSYLHCTVRMLRNIRDYLLIMYVRYTAYLKKGHLLHHITKLAAPPYAPYATLKTFLNRFNQAVPGVIDKNLQGNMSGALWSQIKTALRYLKLVSEDNIPTESMKTLCRAQGEERNLALQAIVGEAYPYIFNEAGFDFSTATGAQIRELITTNATASGETVGRCMTFLKDIARDAGMIVSPYFNEKKTGSKNDRRDSLVPQAIRQPAKAESSLLLWGLFERLPEPRTPWSKTEREQWLALMASVLAMEYPEQED